VVKFQDLKEDAEKFAKGFCKALNENPNYNKAGKGWKGPLLLIMKASGEIEDDISAFADLEDGKCKGIKVLGPGEEPPSEPVITVSGPMYLWKAIAFKEKDPIQCLMTGLLQVDGNMNLVMKYAKATLELANTAEKTDTSLLTRYDLGSEEEE